MNCLKCGREIQEDHVFCDQCLESMKKYPVRPGTAVTLPRRKEAVQLKKTKRHGPPTPQEQIKKLKKQKKHLRVIVFLLSLVILASAAALFYAYRDQGPKPGQNYVVAETSAAAE